MTVPGFNLFQVFLGICFLPLIILQTENAFASNVKNECKSERFLFEQANEFYKSDQMLLSSFHFSELRAGGCDPKIRSRSWVGLALALNQLQESTEARRILVEGLSDPEVSASDRASLQMLQTWIANSPADGLTEDQRQRWALWSHRNDSRVFHEGILTSQIASAEKVKFEELQLGIVMTPQKSLVISGVASALLPGAGQAYTGSWQAAALAFAINSMFLAATIEFAKDDMPYASIAAGTVFSITYVGNILSAVQAAHSSNELRRTEPEAILKKALLPELSL